MSGRQVARLGLGLALIGAGNVLVFALGRVGDVLVWLGDAADRALPEDAGSPASRFRCSACGLSFVHGQVFATHVIGRHPQMLPPGLMDRTP